MENYLTFKGEKYYPVGVSNLYRTLDGNKIFFLDSFNSPIWLSSDTPIHVETRRHVMIDESYPVAQEMRVEALTSDWRR